MTSAFGSRFGLQRPLVAIRREIARVLLLDQPLLVHFTLWLFAAASILTTGYRVFSGTDNHALQLPLVLWLNDPTLFAGDRFVETLGGYTSAVWWAVAIFDRFMVLEPLLLVLFLLGRLALVYAGAYFACCVAPGSRLAPIVAGAFLAIGPIPPIGGAHLVIAYFEQTGVSLVALLLALASVHARRHWAVAAWLAIGFTANPMYGVYAATYIGAAWLADPQFRRGPTIGPLILAALLSLPTAVWAATAASTGDIDSLRWLHAARMMLPYHLLPHTWDREAFRAVAVLLIVGMTFLYRYQAPGRRSRWRTQLSWSATAVAWVSLTFFAASDVIVPVLLVLHPARGLDLWYLALAFSVLAVVASRLESEPSTARLLELVAAFALLSYLLAPPVGTWPLVALIGLGLIAGLVASAISPQSKSAPVWISVGLIVMVTLMTAREQEILREKPPGNWRGAVYEGPHKDLMQVADWVRRATPKGATFMVDPTDWAWSHFRYLAQRPVFLTWKDGSALLWDRSFADVWLDRLAEMGVDYEWSLERPARLLQGDVRRVLKRSFTNLADDDRLRIAQRNAIDFWVVRIEEETALPVVFESKHFKVLAVVTGTALGASG